MLVSFGIVYPDLSHTHTDTQTVTVCGPVCDEAFFCGFNRRLMFRINRTGVTAVLLLSRLTLTAVTVGRMTVTLLSHT